LILNTLLIFKGLLSYSFKDEPFILGGTLRSFLSLASNPFASSSSPKGKRVPLLLRSTPPSLKGKRVPLLLRSTPPSLKEVASYGQQGRRTPLTSLLPLTFGKGK